MIPFGRAPRPLSPARLRSRGMLLAAFVISLPAALLLFLLALNWVDIAMREAKRNEQRVQARLLAESALAILNAQHDPVAPGAQPGHLIAEGEITLVGRYRITLGAEDEDGALVLCEGTVVNDDDLRPYEMKSFIRARISREAPDALPRLEILEITYRVSPSPPSASP